MDRGRRGDVGTGGKSPAGRLATVRILIAEAAMGGARAIFSGDASQDLAVRVSYGLLAWPLRRCERLCSR